VAHLYELGVHQRSVGLYVNGGGGGRRGSTSLRPTRRRSAQLIIVLVIIADYGTPVLTSSVVIS